MDRLGNMNNKLETEINIQELNKLLSPLIKMLGGNSGSLKSVLKAISPQVTIAVGSIGLMYQAMSLVAKTSLEGVHALGEINSALADLGDTAVNNSIIDANNELQKFNNSLGELSNSLKYLLGDIATEAGVFNALSGYTRLFQDISNSDEYVSPNSKILDTMVNSAFEKYGQNRTETLNILNDIVAELRNMGTNDSYNYKMASSWYSMSLKIAEERGTLDEKTVQKIVKDLMKGEGSKYGVTNNDDALYGWLYDTKGINPYNVKMTDAKLEQYRNEFTYEVFSDRNSAKMQKQIKQWMELNELIKNASNGLYNFEKIISTSAVDNQIPSNFDEELISDDEVKEVAKQEQAVENYLKKIEQYRKALKQALDDGIIDQTTYDLMSQKLDRLELEVKYANPDTLEEVSLQFSELDALFKDIGNSEIDPDFRLEQVKEANENLTDLLQDIYELNETNGRINMEAYLDELSLKDWKKDIDEWLADTAHKLNVEVNYVGAGKNPNFDGLIDADDPRKNTHSTTDKEKGNLWDLITQIIRNQAFIKTYRETDGNWLSAYYANALGTNGWTNPLNLMFGLSSLGRGAQLYDGYKNSEEDGMLAKSVDSLVNYLTGDSLDTILNKYFGKDSNKDNKVQLNNIEKSVQDISSNAKLSTTANDTYMSKEGSFIANLLSKNGNQLANNTTNNTENNNTTITNNFNITERIEPDTTKLFNQITRYINQSLRTNNGRISTSGISKGAGYSNFGR